ncbi:MAG: hypothetical protein ACYC3I_13090 [Gemmataceae bacterium]
MMDELAEHVGFYAPVCDPVFQTVYKGKALLTFETVEAVRQAGFAEASFQATLRLGRPRRRMLSPPPNETSRKR